MAITFASADELLGSQGQDLGSTEWVEMKQDRVNLFADATDDHQWIHVDPERAKDGPFGACVAHGYLTLALVNRFLPDLIDVQNLEMGINYGLDRLRFPAPVKVGARIRGRGEIMAVEPVRNSVQATIRVTVEIEDSERPGCVADTISRYTFKSTGEPE